MPTDRYQEAKELLSQKLIPGRDQEQLYSSLAKLEDIITEVQEQRPSKATYLITETQDLYQTAELQRLNPRTPVYIRKGLDELTAYVGDMLERLEAQPLRAQKLLINIESLKQQNTLSSLGLSGDEYEYIPYMGMDASPELYEMIEKTGLQAHTENIYYVRPLASTSQIHWNQEAIGLPAVWEKNAGGETKVGIVDSGCKYSHAEINHAFGNVLGYNFVDNNGNVDDDNGHGTHVAGTVAGMDVGVAPNARLYALKTLNAQGSGLESSWLRAGEWAIKNGLEVLNASFGSSMPSKAEHTMIKALRNHGITVVAAAGNSGNTGHHYPASYPEVISVAATDKNNKRAGFSQINDQLTISAPGVGIYSCTPTGYKYLRGTSMACPHVTGAVAILYANGDKNNARERLTASAQELGEHREYGAGLLRTDRMIP